MKMPGAQTGTFQQSLNSIVRQHMAALKAIPAGQELPNQRVKALRAIAWARGVYISARKAEELLSLHGIMAWTQQTIKARAAQRKAASYDRK